MKNARCMFGLHDYDIREIIEINDFRGVVVERVIISRCTSCGRIKSDRISLIPTANLTFIANQKVL